MEPKVVQRNAFYVMGVQVHSMPDRVDFGAVWSKQYSPHDEAVKALAAGPGYYGVWLPGEVGDGIPDYIAGMAVNEGAQPPAGLVVRRVPAALYAVFDCKISQLGELYSHGYMDWLATSPYDCDHTRADIEYYPPAEGASDPPAVLYKPIQDRSR